MAMPHYLTAQVVSIEPLKEYVRLAIKAEPIAKEMRPGQFAMLSLGCEPLLPRPFSIAMEERGVLYFVFQSLGKGTARLASLRPGDSVKILGPLGRAFSEVTDMRPVIVAGGRGIAPFFELVRRLQRCAPVLFYGGRTQGQIVETGFFARRTHEMVVTTEDGSMGTKGLITEPIAAYLSDHRPPIVYACGPHALLHKVADLAGDIRTELSMEANMACGFGICMGCAIPAGEAGFKRVCVDGPIFSSRDIRWKDLK
ncbi:MAG: dihydroorotate dehydrogenase electron transfer subunit [Acidobacteriota bacterium]